MKYLNITNKVIKKKRSEIFPSLVRFMLRKLYLVAIVQLANSTFSRKFYNADVTEIERKLVYLHTYTTIDTKLAIKQNVLQLSVYLHHL